MNDLLDCSQKVHTECDQILWINILWTDIKLLILHEFAMMRWAQFRNVNFTKEHEAHVHIVVA